MGKENLKNQALFLYFLIMRKVRSAMRGTHPFCRFATSPPFHRGSLPVGVTKQVKGEPVSVRRRIRFYRLLEKAKYIEKAGNKTYLLPALPFYRFTTNRRLQFLSRLPYGFNGHTFIKIFIIKLLLLPFGIG